MKEFTTTILAGTLAGIVVTVFILLLGLPLMWLWNWLMPDIFGLQTITFWQAVGLNIMGHILFKSHIIKTSDK